MVNYVVILLLPAMLTADDVGFTQPAASRALAISNYGGVAGAILGALVIQRMGSRITMLGMSAAAIVSAIVLTGTRLDPTDTAFLMVMLLLTGGLLNAVQTTMYALAAHVYPTEIRSTGVGFAVAVGRIGNVLAGFVGNYALIQGGPPGYFTSMAILMGIVLLSLAAVRRHVPRPTGGSAVAATASAH
jgi:AAHS family 4-hydroxybenzoate transporter-like MFS transporter